ncbi:peroxisome membrane protein [Tilletiaria anomala UBC 951]|uniref:Peroxisomal membrane protein PEX16 n=1 Tax=Tilletiaria anomala (strain ATCC 24038 / CBS 436.72 / UBC 951) TaxID=1037660 RepID=A0A066V951_TILAU|nr:peroxisome membrane protein [Tilletiaria anomala UBC 951]KDN35264.1 peroxisome membrane protein [Tilletiaria anomala UBC 951]
MATLYQSFLLSNASQITAVESTLRSITYFLPGRFKDAELAGEAIYSALNVLGFYHDSILSDLLSTSETSIGITPSSTNPSLSLSSSELRTQEGPQLALPASHTPSQHARYTNYWSRSSALYKRASQLLVLISHTELLIEMLAVRYHHQSKIAAASRRGGPAATLTDRLQPMNIVILLESLKAALRLVLWRCTGERTLLSSNPLPEREVDPAELELERRAKIEEIIHAYQDEKPGLPSAPRSHPGEKWDTWRGKRTGLTRPTLRSLRPGAKEVVAAGLLCTLPPHPLAESFLAHGSDSDETTLVDPEEEEEEMWLQHEQERVQRGWTDAQVNSFLLSRTLAPTDVLKPPELVRPVLGNVGRMAEILWIIRPVLYALSIRRYGKHSLLPFYFSLLVEYLARQLRKRSFSPNLGFGQRKPASPPSNTLLGAFAGSLGGRDMLTSKVMSFLSGGGADSESKRRERPVSIVEANEWAKRDSSFWWYLLRGPAWDTFTRPRLERIIASLERRPLLGLLGGIVSVLFASDDNALR